MDVSDAINTRRSVRKFLSIPVEWEHVMDMLDAGRMAPSAGNLQNWRFIVYTDPDKIKELAEACLQQYWIAEAPLVIVVVGETEAAHKYYGERGAVMYTMMAGGAVTQNIMLKAHDLGLASCWVSAFEDEMMARATGIPDGVSVLSVLPIGYPNEKPDATPRFDLVWFTRFHSYGNRFTDIVDVTAEYNEYVSAALKKGKELFKKLKDKLQDVKE